jgi:hypothetical protein
VRRAAAIVNKHLRKKRIGFGNRFNENLSWQGRERRRKKKKGV